MRDEAPSRPQPPSESFRFGYAPALDGVRAIAIIAVLAYHSIPHVFSGFLGVDLFFALSGFLITGLLLQEHDDTCRVSLRRFYERRALRLLPALAVACVLVSLITAVRRPPGAYSLWVVLVLVVFYVANWSNAFHGVGLGYFGHTWSLAIEEQFYLVWPSVFIRMLNRRPDRLFRRIVEIIVVIAVLRGFLWVASVHDTGLRDWSVLAGDELLAGAAAAVFLWQRRGQVRVPLQVVVGAVVVLALLAVTMHTHTGLLYLGGYTVFAAAAAIVILHLFTAPSSWLSRKLSSWPLIAIGRVSYGIYLFHFPIFMYLKSTSLGLAEQLAIGYPATLAITLISWKFVERPCLKRKPRPTGEHGGPAPSRLVSA